MRILCGFEGINKFMKNNFFLKNFSILISGTVLAQLIPLMLSPFLSRIYTPENFGKFALFTTLSGLLSTMYTLRYEIPILSETDNVKVKKLVSFCYIVVFFLGSVSMLGFIGYYCFYPFDEVLFLVPLCSIILSGILINDKLFNKYEKYKMMSLHRVVKNLVEGFCNLLVGFKVSIHLNLVYNFFIGTCFAFFFSLLANRKFFRSLLRKINKQEISGIYQTYSSYRIYTLPHTILSQLSDNIFVFVIPWMYSNEVLGYIFFGLRLFQTPLGFVSASLSNIISQQFTSGAVGFKIRFLLLFKWMCLIAIIIFPFTYFFPSLFSIFFGENWEVSGRILRMLSLYILLSTIVSSFAFIPIYSGRQKSAFFMEIISTLCKVCALCLGYFLDLSFDKMLFIYAMLATIYMLLASLWIYSLLKKI
jgi:O-antigen/teichoic acid export membrane protein